MNADLGHSVGRKESVSLCEHMSFSIFTDMSATLKIELEKRR